MCSMALYRLYEDWTKDGFQIPDSLYDFQGEGKIVCGAGVSDKTSGGAAALTETSKERYDRDHLNFKYVDMRQPGELEQAQVRGYTSSVTKSNSITSSVQKYQC